MTKNAIKVPSYRINDEIRYSGDVRVLTSDNQSEIMNIAKARRIAEDKGVDLVEVSTSGALPVVRIISYNKLLYTLKKNAKKNKQKPCQIKEVQLSVGIAAHDLKIKEKHARGFISDGNKVKVILSLKGREKIRREENKKSLLEFIVTLNDVAVPESLPQDVGNKVIVILKRK